MATSTLIRLLARCADLLQLRDTTTEALKTYCPNVVITDSFEQFAVCKADAVVSPKFCAKLMKSAAYELSDANDSIQRLTTELAIRTEYCCLPWYKRMLTAYEQFEKRCIAKHIAMQTKTTRAT